MIIATLCTWCNSAINPDEYVIPLRPIADPITGEERYDFLCNACSHDEEVTTAMAKEFLE